MGSDATHHDEERAKQPSPKVTSADDVLRLIGDVEEQLASLRKAHEVRRQELAEIKQRREELEARERSAVEVAQRVEQERRRIEELREECETRAAEIERRQSRLEALTEQLNMQSESLAQRAQEVDERARTRQQELDRLHDEIEQARADIQATTRQLEVDRAKISTDEAKARRERDEAEAMAQAATKELASLRDELLAAQGREQTLAARLTEHEQRLFERERQAGDLASEAEALRRAAEERLARIEETEAELERLRGLLGQTEGRIEVLSLERDELAGMLNDADKDQGELRLRVDALAAEVEQSKLAAEDAGRELQAAVASRDHALAEGELLRQRLEALEAELAERTQEAESLRRSLAEKASHSSSAELKQQEVIDNLHRQVAELQHAAEQAVNAGRTALAEAEEAHKAELDRLEAQAAAAGQRVAELEQTVRDAESWSRAMEHRVTEVEQAAESRIREAEAQAALLSQKIESLESALAQAKRGEAEAREEAARSAALAEEAQARLLTSTAGASQTILDLERRSAELAEQIDALEAELARARTGNSSSAPGDAQAEADARLKERLAALMRERDELSARAELAESQLEEAQQRIEDADRALKQTKQAMLSGATASLGDELLVLRRRRLKRAHALMRVQAMKIRKASAALSQRFEQCEELLRMRGDVVNAKRKLAEAESSLSRRRAAFKTSWTLLGVLCSVALLCGISWVAAERIAPSEFAARVSIVPEAGGRTLSEAEAEEWRRYHESLLTDPRLMENAGQRFSQRGIADLADPAALAAHMKASLVADAPASDRLDLELRGRGSAATQRTLDTFAKAVVSEANAARQRRAVGVLSKLTGEVAVIGPVSSQRTMYAAVGAGASVVLCGVFGLLAWRRLSRSKDEFEKDQQVQMVMDDARWVSPVERVVGRTEQ
ncbi:MAG: hypothetical protein KF866_05060 [Phycisphaeraceae bacterium]|nr:hypothetical protein [Phycisphaeraceae bacterium]MCW5755486.1 hypothetical protein [Phycisphaeraceae bacterium]